MAQVTGDIEEHTCVCVSVNIYEYVHEYTHILHGCDIQSQQNFNFILTVCANMCWHACE